MANEPVPVYDKYGRKIGVRAGSTDPIKTESRAEAYRRQKKGSREEWAGQHEAEAKKIEAEESEASKAKGVTPKAADPAPIDPKPREKKAPATY